MRAKGDELPLVEVLGDVLCALLDRCPCRYCAGTAFLVDMDILPVPVFRACIKPLTQFAKDLLEAL